MFKYAQLDENNMVVGISDLKGEVVSKNMILINDLEVELGSTYDLTTQTFIPPVPSPVEAQPTLEDKINYIYYKEMGLII